MNVKLENNDQLLKYEIAWLKLGKLEREVFDRYATIEGYTGFEAFCSLQRAASAGLVKF